MKRQSVRHSRELTPTPSLEKRGAKSKKLPRAFYLRPTLTIAKDLLGRCLVRRLGSSTLVGKIIEVEAYMGEKDPASHAFRRKTLRNEVMFREGGYLYVYFTYGMHYCCNIVTEEEGKARAVLLRALEPIQGIEIMRENRRRGKGSRAGEILPPGKLTKKEPDTTLTNGPAKLCEAFGIAREENGTDLLGNTIYLTEGEPVASPRSIVATTRIGIKEALDRRWRFYIKGNAFVSRK